MFGQRGVCGDRDDRLAEGVFVSSVDGFGAAAMSCRRGVFEVLPRQRVQRELFHTVQCGRALYLVRSNGGVRLRG